VSWTATENFIRQTVDKLVNGFEVIGQLQKKFIRQTVDKLVNGFEVIGQLQKKIYPSDGR